METLQLLYITALEMELNGEDTRVIYREIAVLENVLLGKLAA